jgi:tyrosinase
MIQTLDRRALLTGSMSLGALASTVALGGCEDFFNRIRHRPVRQNVATLDPNGSVITTFKNAVKAMKGLPTTDNRYWNKQAEIHNNHCPHGNWFFLSWHRAYLFAFEQICRKLTGDSSFALPYWHWQAQPSIPGPFWGGSTNPLFDMNRVATATSVANPSFIGADALQSVLDNTNFELFASGSATMLRPPPPKVYGALEATPHNYIHGTFVLGDMGGFMSPLDAVFWCHHCMIDCMWVAWNIRCGNANTNDTTWTQFSFTDFFDENGAATTISTVATILMPLLSYRYDDPLIGHGTCPSGASPISTTPPPPPTGPWTMKKAADIDRDTLRKFLEKGAPSKLDIVSRLPIARGLTMEGGKAAVSRTPITAEQLAPVLGNRQRLLLSIADVKQPPETDAFLRAFVNLPEASADTPTTDPHYAGSFAFFGGDHGDMPGMAGGAAAGVSFLVDVSETVRRLKTQNQLAGDALAVTLVAVPGPAGKPPGPFSVGELSLALNSVAARQ